MYCVQPITTDLWYLGASDRRLDLFENVFPIPRGTSYNAYLVLDEKTVLLDTVDKAAGEQFQENLEHCLQGRPLDYVVVNHMEPDHCATLCEVLRRWPEAVVVGNAKTFAMIDQFFGAQAVAADRRVLVKEGDTLPLGSHTLQFLLAPMVHWPEVMFSYETSEKVLFSADAFGRFGAVADYDGTDWAGEARRYYLNIVGKYGVQVQSVLKKVSALEVSAICPLHGPVLTGDLTSCLHCYDVWSSYRAEEPEQILVASASIHGNTRAAAHTLAEKLRAQGAQVVEMDLTRTDVSYAVTEAFRCGKTVLACATYDCALFPPMETLLSHLKSKNFQGRTIALMENGSWGPMAAKLMRAELETMKNITICEQVVTLRSAANAASEAQMDALVQELLAK